MKQRVLTDIPEIIHDLAQLADRNGYSIYVVGGYVRDRILGIDSKDIDFTVVGDAIAFAHLVAESKHSKAVIYERFRTALVPVGEYLLEFVGTRKEEYKEQSRKPIVTEGTFEDDINRRDFTVNCLALSLQADSFGSIIDLHDGQSDLEKKLLRTPLDPVITFSDDPLRMMRAARFASKLECEVDPEAINAMKTMADRISIISQERISDEFINLLKTKKPSIGLNILHETGLLRYVFPELDSLSGIELIQVGDHGYAHKDVFLHTLQVLDNLCEMSDNVWLRFATLMHDIAKPKTKRFIEGIGWSFHGHEELGARWQSGIFRRMKLPLEHINYVETLVRLHQRPMVLVDDGVTDSAIRRLAVHAGDTLDDLFLLCKADITTKNSKKAERYLRNYEKVYQKILDVRERDHLRAFQSPVRGEEIMELCALQPSPAIGYIKHMIEEAILEGIIPNDHEEAKNLLLQKKDQWLEEAKHYKKHLTQFS
ncbi:MAG: HD domain-containing protein [Ignavibacteria bacterium]|nr:HD domain-containing protein [Ignavibacteria bacterium]